MLLSMTGFGKATALAGANKITVEIKSLNSKQMDLAARLPQLFRSQELELRQVVTRELLRGKVDFNIFLENSQGDSAVTLNVARIESYRDAIKEISKAIGVSEPDDWFGVLLRLPDVIKQEAPADATSQELTVLNDTVMAAIGGLKEFRAAEGRRLTSFFEQRIAAIRELLAQVPQYEQERVGHIKSRIADALERIPHVDYDKGRLEQEMIFYIEKLDITEEKQRLTQHLDYFLETMAVEPGQGKKLGFIAQEMGREINTLGSKSNQADMQILVVRMKDELEQIKEQVLNVL